MQSEESSPTSGLPKSEITSTARARLPRPVREQQMLDAATEIFGSNGYHGSSMDQIAEAVGISKPMLYAYFDSKEGLYSACIKRAGTEILDAVSGSFDPSVSTERILWSGFVAFFEFVREHPSKWQLLRTESVPANGPFAEIVVAAYNEFRALIDELTRIASKETPGDPFADAELRGACAYAMLGAATALANRWLDTDCKTTPTDFSTQLMNFFWLGFNDMAEGEIWSPEGSDAIAQSAVPPETSS